MNITKTIATGIALAAALILTGCGSTEVDVTPSPTVAPVETITPSPEPSTTAIEEVVVEPMNTETVIQFDDETSTVFRGETYTCDEGAVTIRIIVDADDNVTTECAFPATDEFVDLFNEQNGEG